MSARKFPADGQQFDYIIIGAGSAGCVLANRLSEDPSLKVCLIEAGPKDNSLLVHVPMLSLPSLFSHPRMNWRFMTTRQRHADNRPMYVPRGKVLGGSSAINGMVYMRGHPQDYDEWSGAGCDGWSFAEVLPYFLRSEKNGTWRDSIYHGNSGPLGVEDIRARNPLTLAFLNGAQLQGIPLNEDFNGASQFGAGYRQITQRSGMRASTASAFLKPIRDRRNLTVVTHALADHLIFQGRRAIGISVLAGKQRLVLNVDREIILSAGAIGSPHILLRSGIGDGKHLQDHGILPIHNLPGVGRNLQEHPTIGIANKTLNTEPYGVSIKAFPRLAWAFAEYIAFRRGLLSSNGFEVGAFVKTQPDLDRPDVQLSLMTALPRSVERDGAPSIQFGYGYGYNLTAVHLRPHSRGAVTLASRNPQDPPVIDPHFLEDDRDVDVLLAGFKIARKILNSSAFDRYRSTELAPGRDVQSDEGLRSYIRASGGFAFHPVGTCAMGRIDSSNAVVDPLLRVRGIEGLRVVDASIMPDIPSGNTNAPTIMIAEKAADMIKGHPPLGPLELGDQGRAREK